MTKELEETTNEYNEKGEIVRKRLVAISKAGEALLTIIRVLDRLI